MRRALVVVIAALLVLPQAAAAQAPEVERSIDAGRTLLAQVCGLLPLTGEACALFDGHVIDGSEVDAYEGSWVHRALRLQERLDDDEPLRRTLWPHTHNSSNSTAYLPSVSNIDPNQRYSILDQLRMDVRAIELDVHWFAGRVVLCHGETVAVATLTIHVGCSIDRPLADGLTELRTFLDAPGNEDEVVLLYLENNLDGRRDAHDIVARQLAASVGDLVYRPPADDPCADMPLDLTTNELRATGARVLIVGNCGPGAWGTWVHERGPEWDEAGRGGDYPVTCDGEDPDRWTRIYEDSTWLTAITSGVGVPLGADAARTMVRCGVDMIGFDRLEPFDGRLEALVWSWAPGEPSGPGCVGSDADGRFRMAPCDLPRRFACRTAAGDWLVPHAVGPASDAAAVCQTGAAGSVPATPTTGWDNERLRAVAGPDPVWLG